MRERPTLVSGGGAYNLYLFAFILLTILLVAWVSMTAIRRQLQPLAVLTQATKRIARRDFAALPDASWKDEFGDLARSFSAMSDQLRMQFSALETLSEIDRLLLHAPELESILSTLLPRIADLMQCDSVSVLLFDPDSAGHARAYDYYASQPSQPRVRRIAAGVAELKRELESSCVGALCIGRAEQHLPGDHSGLGVADFTGRLSLILASLEQSEALHRQANFDPLTGLQNRQLFSAQLLKAVAAAQAAHGMGALLYIDLDQFKHVNDTAGHGAGDGLLRAVGERLIGNAADGRSVARLGGDEFAILLPRIAGPESACDGIAVEALARWPGNSPEDWIPPATFIPIAEETDQIIELGDWVLRTACRQFAQWRAQAVGIEYISVNVSVRQLSQGDFAARLRAILAQTGMRGRELQIEVTESVLACGEQLEKMLQEIVAQDVRVALDDFGTGYSSLSYLSKLPIQTVRLRPAVTGHHDRRQKRDGAQGGAI